MARNILYTTTINGEKFEISESIAATDSFWLAHIDEDGNWTSLYSATTNQRLTPEEFHISMFDRFNDAIARFFALLDTPVDEMPDFNGNWEDEVIWRVENRSETVNGQLTINI